MEYSSSREENRTSFQKLRAEIVNNSNLRSETTTERLKRMEERQIHMEAMLTEILVKLESGDE